MIYNRPANNHIIMKQRKYDLWQLKYVLVCDYDLHLTNLFYRWKELDPKPEVVNS